MQYCSKETDWESTSQWSVSYYIHVHKQTSVVRTCTCTWWRVQYCQLYSAVQGPLCYCWGWWDGGFTTLANSCLQDWSLCWGVWVWVWVCVCVKTSVQFIPQSRHGNSSGVAHGVRHHLMHTFSRFGTELGPESTVQMSGITLHNTTVYWLQNTVYWLQNTVYWLQNTVYWLQNTVYWLQN